MESILLTPPLAFLIYLLLSAGISRFAVVLSAKGKLSTGKEKAYACGEDVPDHRVQPDYSQFFPVAIFFTIMHVIALTVATVPSGIPAVALLYIILAFISIFILFRR